MSHRWWCASWALFRATSSALCSPRVACRSTTPLARAALIDCVQASAALRNDHKAPASETSL